MLGKPHIYIFFKIVWLLMHAIIMPAAVAFLVLHGYLSSQSMHFEYYAVRIVGSGLIVLWIIGTALLSMYRFPLNTGGAVRMVFTAILQFLLIFALGGDILFALYSNFLSSFAAMATLAIVILVVALFTRKIPTWSAVFVFIAIIIIGLTIWKISEPFVDNLKLMEFWAAACSVFLIASGAVSIVAGLYKMTIFGGAIVNKAYYEEWERWAPATAITLIISVVAAFALGGILQAV